MNKFKDLGKDVPPTEHEFTVDVEGQATKKRYIGEFSCKIPRLKEQCMIAKHKAFLNGDFAQFLDPATLKTHHMISYLRYTLDTKDCPKWWRESDLGYELLDMNVVEAVYNEVLEFERKWLAEIWGEEELKKLEEESDESGEAEEKGA